MKKLLLSKHLVSTTIFVLSILWSQAQDVQWINGYTDNLGSSGIAKIDASGNVYIAGGFFGTIDFDPGPGTTNLTSNGSFDIFISKLDASGNLIWARSIGNSENDGVGTMELDASGNVYVTGWFQGTNTDFDPGAGTSLLTSAGGTDVYVLKLNTLGNFQWVYQGGGSLPEEGHGLAIDGSGNVYVAGDTWGGDFDNTAGTTTLGGNGNKDAFLVQLNSSGTFQWGVDFGGTGRDEVNALELESSGDIFVGGIFSNTVDFDPSGAVANRTSNGLLDAFLVQLNSSGGYQEVITWGGTANDGLNDFAFTSSGSVVATSYFDGTIDIDPYAGTTNATAGSSNTDQLVQHLDIQSDALLWSKQIDITGAGIFGVDIDNNDRIYHSGFYSLFGVTEIYSVAGNTEFASSPAFSMKSYGIEVHGSDFYIHGSFSGNTNFDLCGGTNNVNGSSGDKPFLAKYSIESLADTPTLTATNTNVCGSETVTLSIQSGNLNSATNWQWRSGSCSGTFVGNGTSVMVTPTVTTTYYARGTGYSCLSPGDCASITITVSDPPTDIAISSANIDEELNIGTTVGTFSTVDATVSDTHTYTLVSGTGDADNASFSISSNQLRSAEVFDFETKNTYSIRVQTEDNSGCTYQESFNVTINNVAPELPTDIILSSQNIDENQAVNSVVGSLSSIDDDIGETYSYTLVAGAGSTDNGAFNISGSNLRTSEVFDFETKNSYSIRINTNDGNGGNFSKAFTITVNNVIETDNDILTFSIPEQVTSPTIDNVAHEVAVEVPFGTNQSAMTPTFTISSGASSNPLSGVTQNFNSPFNYSVTAEDGTDQMWTVTVFAPIPAGTHTIGSGGDFTSLTTALNYLSDNGIAGDVTFELLNGQSIGSLDVYSYPGTSAHSVLIRPESGVGSLTITASGTLSLRGVENFTFDGENKVTYSGAFTITQNSGTTSKNVTIKNTSFDSNFASIDISGSEGVDIDGNTFRGQPLSGSTYQIGMIRITTGSSNLTIQNNDFLRGQEFDSPSNSSILAISCINQVTGYLRIYNNTIYLNPARANTIRGMGAWADDVEVYHNTILINGGNGQTSFVQGMSASASNSLTIKNNIIEANAQTDGDASASKVGITYTTGASTTTIEDNNITFVSEGINGDGFIRAGSTVYDEDDLATIESLFPGTTSANATFVDEGNEDYKLTGASLSEPDLRGNPVALVTTDQEGILRSVNAPSKGAFESPNNIADILSMTFGTIAGVPTIDNMLNTVDAEVAAGGDVTSLAPTFTLFPGASISPVSGTTRDFTSSQTYTVTAENSATEMWTVSITEQNGAPTDLALSSPSINENAGNNAIVSVLLPTDPNSSDTHTYQLVAGSGSADNGLFNIDGSNLRATNSLDFEASSTRSVRIRVTDGGGLFFEKEFTITIVDTNDAPNDAFLSNSSVQENLPIGTVVGTLTTADQDVGDTHTYSFKPGTPDNAFFTIDGDQLRTGAIFDFETKNTYNLEIFTNDGNGGQFEQEFAIAITDELSVVNDITLSANSLDENSGSGITIGSFSAQGTDLGGAYTFSFATGTGDAGNSAFNISGSDLLSFSGFSHEVFPSITIRVEAAGLGGPFEKVFTININDLPEDPTDIGLDNNSIQESLAVGTLVGNLSTTDEDAGETHTYSLVSGIGDTDNASFTIDGDRLESAEVFDFETKNSYSVRIQTNDGNGGLYEEAFTITIDDLPPSITDIGLTNDQINENNTVPLTVGTFSTIGEEVTGSYTYSLVSGPGSTANSSFFISGDELRTGAVFNHEAIPTASIRVRTDDGMGSFFEKIFIITVNDVNEAPTDISLSASSITENNAINDVIGALSSVDVDAGSSHTYALVPGIGDTDNASFNINSNSLRASEIFDFESKSSYSIRVQTNDGNGGLYEEAFTVSIDDIGPTVTDIGLTNDQINENNTVPLTVGTFSTLGEEVTGSYTYSLVSGPGSTANSSFFISGDDLRTGAVFNHEIIPTASIRVRTDDGMGSSFEKIFIITVNDVNEAPTDIALSANDLDENNAVNDIIGTLTTTDVDAGSSHTYALVSGIGDTDNGSFNISGNQLRASEVFNFESKSSYAIRIQTDDGNGGNYEEAFTISINDLNETPVFANQAFDLPENATNGTLVGTLVAMDPDSDPITFSNLTGTTAFSLAANGELTLINNSDINHEDDATLILGATASDDGTPVLNDMATIQINVTNVNEVPTDLLLSNSSIDESTPIGTGIGNFSSVDEDAGETFTYTLASGGVDNASFDIVGTQLQSAVVFDFESKSTFNIRVRTTDSGGLTREEDFTITINDLPASVTDILAGDQMFDENLPIGTSIETLTTIGEDLSGSFTYSLVSGVGDADNASFSIDGDQLRTAAEFNFEIKSNYTIRIQSDDGIGNIGAFNLNFTINDANDSPTDLSIDNAAVAENAVIGTSIGSFTSTDEDPGQSHTYALVSGTGDTDNASFTIVGDQLQSAEVFDFETKSSYSVRVQTDDGNGGTYQEVFTITINNQNESLSVINPIQDVTFDQGFGTSEIDLSNVFDNPDNDVLTYSAQSTNTNVATVSVLDATLTITEVGAGTSTITVTVDDGSGVTTSDEFELTITEAALGIVDELLVEVYPNPVADFLNVRLDQEVDVRLVDGNGRTLQIKQGRNLSFDVRQLSSGVYFVMIRNGSQLNSIRVIKR